MPPAKHPWTRPPAPLRNPKFGDILASLRRVECSAILFDLDGVLLDSAAWIELQWRRWAERRALDPAPFLRVCHGRRAVETIRLAAPELDAEAEVARFDPADELVGEPLRPVAGAERVLG